MDLKKSWMTDNSSFGTNYVNTKQLNNIKARYDLQRYSNEGRTCKIDNVTEQVVIQFHANPTNIGKETIKIITDLECSINVGSIVELDSKKYIIVSKIVNNLAYKTTYMIECNNTLKVYKNKILSTIPCIFSNNFMVLQENNNIINLPAGHYALTLPSGTITKEDLNLRFILNDAPYKIIGINNATTGLIKIEICDDAFTENDNRTLGIADYYTNQIVREVYFIDGDLINKVNGDSNFTLDVVCKDDDVVNSTPTKTFSSSNTAVCTVTNAGIVTVVGTGDCVITVTYQGATDTINISVDIGEVDSRSIVLTPSDITLKANRSLTLNAVVVNNGVEESWQTIDFTVTNADETSNNYVTYSENGNSITITAGAVYNKFITIRAYMAALPDIYVDRSIKLISLI